MARIVQISNIKSNPERKPNMKIFSKFKDKVEQRRATCDACPHIKVNALQIKACSLCGCPIASKTLVPSTACPDNPPRW